MLCFVFSGKKIVKNDKGEKVEKPRKRVQA